MGFSDLNNNNPFSNNYSPYEPPKTTEVPSADARTYRMRAVYHLQAFSNHIYRETNILSALVTKMIRAVYDVKGINEEQYHSILDWMLKVLTQETGELEISDVL